MNRVYDLLYQVSPYANFDPAPYPADLQGWGSYHPALHRAIDRLRPRSILEVGSWKGASAIHIANHVKHMGLECEVVCVDTWLGSSEHWLRRAPGWYESLQLKNGYPSLYYTFLSNVVRAELQDYITPFPATSEMALKILRERGFYFDFIYVDAAHEYDPVRLDLKGCWYLLREPGILIGDDYLAWDEVIRAANEFAAEQGIPIIGENEKFILSKGRLVPSLKS